ncbi:MarR family winged helix-turn-helix transcriptional regulator [Aestuariibius sp. HNIBRBA575]|uniref:MarR family winged helix-turn-helix transcriptional regulator n=1 Tax=Aestuariibius sp. HNIBRBA575 TaxID=3233343 RepID=UPI0034A13642
MTETKDDYALHQGLGYRLSRLSKHVQNRLETALAPHGITRLRWCVLSGIGLENVTTPSDIADYIGITRQAASRLLVQMRKDGLIDQALTETDGRSRHLSLTPLGQDKLDLCHPIVRENQAHFSDKLSPKQHLLLDELLAALLVGETKPLDRF